MRTTASAYGANDTIVVTLSNNGAQTIYFSDDPQDCDGLALAYWMRDRWVYPLNLYCRAGALTNGEAVEPGQNRMATFRAPQGGWASGVYAVTVHYTTALGSTTTTLAASAGFRVNGPETPAPLPAPTKDLVTLRTDATIYHTYDIIAVTLSNRRDQSIYYTDGEKYCTDLGLAYRNALSGLWNGYHAYGCGTPTRWEKLDPGQSVTVRFSPPAGDGGWVVGVYIATVYYSTDPRSAPSAYVTSPGFQVV